MKTKMKARIAAAKAISLSTAVRKIVVRNPELSIDEIVKRLLSAGRSQRELKSRLTTVTTVLADSRATIKAAKELGCWKN
jgi:hypothetical protein